MFPRKKHKLKLNSALIVDPNLIGQATSKKYLENLGFSEICVFSDNENAKETLGQKQYDLVVIDWDRPNHESLSFFNCIKRHVDYASVPTLITGWKLKPADMQIFSEFPVTGVVQKPYTEQVFTNECRTVITECASLDANRQLIEQLLNSVDDQRANPVKLAHKICMRLKNPTAVLVHTSRSLTVAGKLKTAKLVLDAGLVTDAYKLPLYTELGRINLLEGNYETAVQLLRHAQCFSSGNLERVLMLGELELKCNNPTRAREHFDEALSIDPDDEDAKRGHRISQRMEEYFSMNDLRDLPKNFASTMNAIAIGLARTRNYRDAVDQYEGAMKMAASESDAQRVAFNLGLLMLRWKKVDEAKPWFELALPLGGDVSVKAKHFIGCIEYRAANEEKKAQSLAKEAADTQEDAADAVDENLEEITANDFNGKTLAGILLALTQQADRLLENTHLFLGTI